MKSNERWPLRATWKAESAIFLPKLAEKMSKKMKKNRNLAQDPKRSHLSFCCSLAGLPWLNKPIDPLYWAVSIMKPNLSKKNPKKCVKKCKERTPG